MEKMKLLTFTVIGLLLLNLSTIGFLYLNHTGNSHTEVRLTEGSRPFDNRLKPNQIIIKKLHFDSEQQKHYQKLIQLHRQEITALEREIRKTKNSLYSQLVYPTIASKTKDSLIDVIANSQKKIEATHFKHFNDIKALCKKEQLNDFYNLTEELSKIFAGKPKPGND